MLYRKINNFVSQYASWLAASAIILYILLFSFICLVKLANFGYNSLDLAIINQVFYNSSQGNFFASSIHPLSYLGDHFSPILFLLLPFYFFYKQPEALLILQTIFLGLSAWPIFLLAKKIINQNLALIFVLLWLLNPFVANLNLFESHFLYFALVFILFAFYFYWQNKFLPFLFFCFLTLLVREDLALVIATFSLLAFLDKKKWLWKIIPLILAGGYFIMAIKISNFFAPGGSYKFLIYYSWLGQTFPEIAFNLIARPWLVLPKIFNLATLLVFFALIMPVYFLPLKKPKYLLLGALVFIQLLLGVSWFWLPTILFTQYSSLLLPPIFIAAIFGAKEFLRQPPKNRFLLFLYNEKPLFIFILLAITVYSAFSLGSIPAGLNKIVCNGLIWPQTKIKNEFLAALPPQAAVAAGYQFLTPLSDRADLASLNYVFLGKQQFLINDYALPQTIQYLIVDFKDLITYQIQYGLNSFYQEQYQSGLKNWPEILAGFGLIKINDQLALYQKNAPSEFKLVEKLAQMPANLEKQTVEINKEINFLGGQGSAEQISLIWQIKEPLSQTYFLKIHLTQGEKTINELIYPFGYGLLNRPELKNQAIQTNYWPDLKNKVPKGTYELSVSLITITKGRLEIDGWRQAQTVIEKTQAFGPPISLGQINL